VANESKLVDDVVAGRIKFHELEKQVSKKEATEIRRKAVEKLLKLELKAVGSYTIDPENVIGKSIENMIGAVQVPLGIAGPVKIKGDHAKGAFYLPLATTEGALVASFNRGCSAITESGGADVKVIDNKQTRAPCFRFEGIKKAADFIDWCRKNDAKIKEKAQEGSRFLKVRKIRHILVGNNVYLRFEAETGDAMGMNMITLGCQQACDWIEKETGAECITVTGNLDVDKKPSAINLILGRGKTVAADVIIPEAVLKEKLKTTASRMYEVNLRKNILGSAFAGSYGLNAHFANAMKALFIATGQDEAHIVDGSHGVTFCEVRDKDLYISVTIPCVQVGTVGGGTRVETAQECLRILGVAGAGEPPGSNALKFAEIVAVATLAGEISLIAAQSAHHLAKAHKELGR
jgi:hydroxymethylglutaryl-CoA reductase (NADPH)